MSKQGLALATVLATFGCTTVQSVQPERFIPEHKPASVTVWTSRDDVTVYSPRIEGDSLGGVVLEDRWAVPLKDIVRVTARAPDQKKTALLVAGVAASSVVLWLAATSGHGAGQVPCAYVQGQPGSCYGQ